MFLLCAFIYVTLSTSQRRDSELSSKLSVYVLEERNCSPRSSDDPTPQWRYRKWSNGTLELWRIGGNVDTFVTSHESVNGVFYSDEVFWYPVDIMNYVTVKEIYQVTGTIDRKGNAGLPQLNIVNCYLENGYPVVDFLITSNRNSSYKISANFYIQARWK